MLKNYRYVVIESRRCCPKEGRNPATVVTVGTLDCGCSIIQRFYTDDEQPRFVPFNVLVPFLPSLVCADLSLPEREQEKNLPCLRRELASLDRVYKRPTDQRDRPLHCLSICRRSARYDHSQGNPNVAKHDRQTHKASQDSVTAHWPTRENWRHHGQSDRVTSKIEEAQNDRSRAKGMLYLDRDRENTRGDEPIRLPSHSNTPMVALTRNDRLQYRPEDWHDHVNTSCDDQGRVSHHIRPLYQDRENIGCEIVAMYERGIELGSKGGGRGNILLASLPPVSVHLLWSFARCSRTAKVPAPRIPWFSSDARDRDGQDQSLCRQDGTRRGNRPATSTTLIETLTLARTTSGDRLAVSTQYETRAGFFV